MAYSHLLLEISERIATLTINRPQVLNALDAVTLRELEAAVTTLEEEPGVKVILLTGAGEKAFVAGGDISAMQPLSPAEARASAGLAQRVLARIETCRKPVIAVINGYALGGGCELAMACDLRLAADTVRLGQPEINLGILPGWGGSQRLPRLVGKGRALELLFTGAMLSAAEAERIGLVNRVLPAAELMPVARELAASIASKSGNALALIKEAVRRGEDQPLDRANILEADLFALSFASADQKEGMLAFLEKRPAKFIDA